MRATFSSTLLAVFGIIFCGLSYASNDLQPGSKYQIIHPLYLMATYNNLNDRRISKDTARAYLHSERYYKKAEVAF